jgi:hypothetical protein
MIPTPPQDFAKTEKFMEYPGESRARFYALTRNGKYASDEFDPDEAANGKGNYSKLFIQANEVISAVRTVSPNR